MSHRNSSKLPEKKKNFHHYKFGQDSDAKNRLSLFSLVLSEQKPLKLDTLKKTTLTNLACDLGHELV